MAAVISISVPDVLYAKWKESGINISPSALFQNALETELCKTNQHLTFWSTRALNAEKKLRTIETIINTPDADIKKLSLFDSIS